MKKIQFFLLFAFAMTACEQSENATEDDKTEDTTEVLESLTLIRTESKTNRDEIETNFDNIDLTYNSDNLLTTYNLEIPGQSPFSIDINYSGNLLSQIGDFSVEYIENQIILESQDRREEYFIENDKIALYKWYQLNSSTSIFELFVTNEFTYDEDFKNVVRTDEFDQNGELISYVTYEYDDNHNPYKNLADVLNIHPILNLDPLGLSNENNVIRFENFRKINNEFIGSTTVITYSYNDLNYPTNLELVSDSFSIDRNFTYQQ